MNELIAEMATDEVLSEGYHSDNSCGNPSLKRNSDFGQSSHKRVKDEDNEEMNSQPNIYNLNDSRLYGDQEEDEPYREYTEEEIMIMDISNQLINFNLNMIAIDWDEYYVDRSEHSGQSSPKPKKGEIEFPLKTSHVIHGYFLEKMISASKRTAVYFGYSTKNPEEQLVIKIGFEMGFHNLYNECNTYQKLKTSESVPNIVDHIWWKTYRDDNTSISWGLIVLEKCGPNLVDVRNMSALGIVGPIGSAINGFAIRMIDAIEGFHKTGFVHLSLKPEHFILSSEDLNQNKADLKLIGLSASKTYLKKSSEGSEEHIEDQRDRKLPKGDPNFHSIGYHNGYRRSRRDDMESLGYCLVYMMKGTLPWMDSVGGLNSGKAIRKIGHKMQTTPVSELCDGLSPAFSRYFDLISKYKFAENPDYEELRKCFELNPH